MTENILIGDVAAVLNDSLAPIIYRPGSVIFREDEPAGGGCAYIIERGHVQITKSRHGKESVLAVLGPGELLGEMAPIDNQNRSATATTIEETEVIPISGEQLKTLIGEADPLIQLLLGVLIDRLRSGQREAQHETTVSKSPALEFPRKPYESVRGCVIDRIKIEKSLRDALKKREFELYYQPVVSLSDYRIAGFEALIRWFSPDQGLVSPMEFINVAEESGLIVPIGQWVLEHSCYMMNRFQSTRSRSHPDQPPLFMCANVSARQLRDPANVENMIAVIRKTGVDPSRLKIEITEGIMLENPEAAILAFNALKAAGVMIALDDFGTGFSSLGYLHRFPLDTLKIDRSFVLSMRRSRESMTIVRAITGLARELKMDCVSEGIEEPEQLALLQELGCEYGQGYMFSKPVPASDAVEMLTKSRLWEPPADSVQPESAGVQKRFQHRFSVLPAKT
jgi:EAL domain-containing protein (putative c-di-GMP-specific phosphodiesterase class I)